MEDLKRRGAFIHTKPLEHNGNSLTHVGKILQKTYIDEFPQFFSILKGDISLVGPRPVNLEVYQLFLKRGHNCKAVIKAGLTGNFQALKGVTSKSDVDLDNQYIEYCRNNSSFKLFSIQ